MLRYISLLFFERQNRSLYIMKASLNWKKKTYRSFETDCEAVIQHSAASVQFSDLDLFVEPILLTTLICLRRPAFCFFISISQLSVCTLYYFYKNGQFKLFIIHGKLCTNEPSHIEQNSTATYGTVNFGLRYIWQVVIFSANIWTAHLSFRLKMQTSIC